MTIMNLFLFYYSLSLSAVPVNAWKLYDTSNIYYGKDIDFSISYISKFDVEVAYKYLYIGGDLSVTTYRDKRFGLTMDPVQMVSGIEVGARYKGANLFLHHDCIHPIAAYINKPLTDRLEGGYVEVGVRISNK